MSRARLQRTRLRIELAEGVVARMAEAAQRHLAATGFCTDDHFRAAGFSAAAVQRHGDRARHRAARAMQRAREIAGANQRGERENEQ